MMHVMYGGKSVLMGDDAATGLLEYAAVLGTQGTADVVNVLAISQDGNETSVAFLLNSSSELTAESTNSHVSAPSNAEAVAYMQDRLSAIRNPPPALTDPELTDPNTYGEDV